jgi:hypothetical protein
LKETLSFRHSRESGGDEERDGLRVLSSLLRHRALHLKHHVTLNEVKGLSRKNSDRLGLKDPSAMPQDDSLYQI